MKSEKRGGGGMKIIESLNPQNLSPHAWVYREKNGLNVYISNPSGGNALNILIPIEKLRQWIEP